MLASWQMSPPRHCVVPGHLLLATAFLLKEAEQERLPESETSLLPASRVPGSASGALDTLSHKHFPNSAGWYSRLTNEPPGLKGLGVP